jgi:5-methylcytosine-specific restriction protein B
MTGKLLTEQQRSQYLSNFRNRFGPEQLGKLDGERLLEVMHGRGGKDCMAYWLEFKDDEEFSTIRFGGIGGGSALKFGVFQRKETNTWATGGKSNTPEDITVAQAVDIARRQRDQLLRSVELLEKLSADAGDDEYRKLQETLDQVAPDVSSVAWGHKYLLLTYPAKLEDFHTEDWQRFYIVKLLQEPPTGRGRYLCAGRYVALARELEIPLPDVPSVLSNCFGGKHRYWRVGTSNGKQPRNRWELMRDSNCVAIGWPKLGDLSWLDNSPESKEKLQQELESKHPTTPQHLGRDRNQVANFVLAMQAGDYVLACDGGMVLGVAKIVGNYEFDASSDFPHRRSVEWLSLSEWKMPQPEGNQTTVHEMKKHVGNLIETERRVQNAEERPPAPRPPSTKVGPIPKLDGIKGRIQAVLEQKGQVILYGPPGTGKTYWAERTALDLAAFSAHGTSFEQLTAEQQIEVHQSPSKALVRTCCFHPAYGYEDFLEGYRPIATDDGVGFVLQPGIFKALCKTAEQQADKRFFLIIDEINRGDIPRIFGELLTVLEKDKRGKRIILPLSREEFFVPLNVFVIGTMNTADRSISLLDAALRRRFGFIELMPDSSLFGNHSIEGIPLAPWFDALNARICEHVGKDARNLQIGHSYLLPGGKPVKDMASFKRSLQDEVIPLLEEYCYQDFAALQKILGPAFIGNGHQIIRHELFQDGREVELIQALLAPCPEISASAPALASDQVVEEEQANDDDEGEDK